MSDEPEVLVRVDFVRPVEGHDPRGDDTFVSTRHYLDAVWARQDRAETLFVNDEGEVVARWATDLIERIEWLEVEDDPAGADSDTSASHQTDSRERRSAIVEQYPHAYETWTNSEEERLRVEFRDGKSIREVAELHERSAGAIRSRLVRLGLVSPDGAEHAWTEESTPNGDGAEHPVCRHDLYPASACTICQLDGRPDVYITGGGVHYHRVAVCPALRKGQASVDRRGGQPESVERVNRGSARLEGRDPCGYCHPM